MSTGNVRTPRTCSNTQNMCEHPEHDERFQLPFVLGAVAAAPRFGVRAHTLNARETKSMSWVIAHVPCVRMIHVHIYIYILKIQARQRRANNIKIYINIKILKKKSPVVLQHGRQVEESHSLFIGSAFMHVCALPDPSSIICAAIALHIAQQGLCGSIAAAAAQPPTSEKC